MESLKAMHVEMKSLVKKHNAREKALAKFEKEWTKSLAKPKKAAKKKSGSFLFCVGLEVRLSKGYNA